MKLRVLDLFSGIGGFSFGLERTGGFETVAFCEIDEHACKVLKKHWPNVPIYHDIKNFDYNGDVDVITGGFPCQDLSAAGQRKGIIDGERSSLWGEMLRLTGKLRPRYMLAENVSALLIGDDGRWFAELLSDLASIGYDAEWHRISAADIGAVHQRERVWIIAYPSEIGRKQSIIKTAPKRTGYMGNHNRPDREVERLISWVKGEAKECWGISGEPMRYRGHDGVSNWMDRVARCGNSIVPQIAQYIGHNILIDYAENYHEGRYAST